MKKTICLLSLLTLTATAATIEQRVAALEAKVFAAPWANRGPRAQTNAPAVIARPTPAPRTPQQRAVDRARGQEEIKKANPKLAARLEELRARRKAQPAK